MDATANDVTDDRFSVKGFPTLYLLTPDKTVLPYSGERTEKEIIKFVEEHASAKAAEPAAAAKADPAAELKDEL
jgi:protein disulfide-isomerase A1